MTPEDELYKQMDQRRNVSSRAVFTELYNLIEGK